MISSQPFRHFGPLNRPLAVSLWDTLQLASVPEEMPWTEVDVVMSLRPTRPRLYEVWAMVVAFVPLAKTM